MQTTYNSLSNYLIGSFNLESTELLYESFTGNRNATDSQKSAIDKLLGGLGCIFTSIFGADKKNDEDPIIKKYNDIAKKEAEDERNRLQKELDAEKDSEIAALEAEYEHNKKQLDIKSQKRVDAYRAKQKQLNELSKRIKNGPAIEYSAEQNAHFLKTIRDAAKDTGYTSDSPAKRMEELAFLISTKSDGTLRTREEIESAMDNPDDPIHGFVKDYNALGKKHGKEIVKGMSSEAFNTTFKTIQNDVRAEGELEEKLKEAKNAQNAFKEKSSAIATVGSIQKDYNIAKEAKEAADKTVKDIEDGKGIGSFCSIDSKGDVTMKSNDDIKAALKEITKDPRFLKKDGTTLDSGKIKKELQKMGVPESVINEIGSESEGGVFKLTQEKFDSAIEGLDETAMNKIKEETQKKAEKDYKSAKQVAKDKARELDSKIDIESEEFKKLSDEDKEAKLREAGYDDTKIAAVKTVSAMSDTERTECDETTDAGKANASQFKKAVDKCEEAINANKEKQAANKKAYEYYHEKESNRKMHDMPKNISNAVEEKASNIGACETMHNGKVGIKVGENFIEKPGPNSTDKEKAEYIRQRDELIMSSSPDSAGKVENPIVEITKDATGDKYTIKRKDGTTEEGLSEAEVIDKKAEEIAKSRQKSEILKKKQEVAEAMEKCIKDGKLDPEKYEEMLNSSDPKVKRAAESIAYIMKSDNGIEEFFKGMDLDGSDTTAEKLKDIVKDSKEEISKTIDNDTDLDKKFNSRDKSKDNSDDDEWEDVEDSDNEDKDDDNEYEGTDENGEKRKLKNPAKTWHKRKKKNGKGTTKNYYDKDGNSISSDDYKDMVARYKKAKDKNESVQYSNLKNYLLEHFNKKS